MKTVRQWIISATLQAEANCQLPYVAGEQVSVDIAVTCHELQEALGNITTHVSELGFRLTDITNAEIFSTRTFYRNDRALFIAALDALTWSGHNAPGVCLGKIIDKQYIEKIRNPGWYLRMLRHFLPGTDPCLTKKQSMSTIAS